MKSLIRALPALVLFAAACSDRTPLSGGIEPGPQPRAEQRLECTARVAAGTVTCVDATAGAGGARGNLVLGGGFVQLASSNVDYDSATSRLRADVTVKNLLRQAIGTVDGTTADSAGVKVFFHTGPTLTQGSGAVSVANADGSAAFTAGVQPFFRYTGVLQPLQTSAPREWLFNVGHDVQEFVFTLYVSAPVADEDGWVDVSPPHPYVHAGGTRQMAATVRNGAGTQVDGATVTWSSSDPSIATVDAAGVVTAHAAGTVTITATSGARTGAQQLTVTAGEGDVTPPTLTGFTFTPHQVDVSNNSAQVTVIVSAEDAGTGVYSMSVVFRSPSQTQDVICSTLSYAGSGQSAVFQCTLTVPSAAEAGSWKPAFVSLRDQVSNEVSVTAPKLAAAGFWTDLRVDSDPDTVAPTLTGLSFTPDSVDITGSGQQVRVTVTATDDKAGLQRFAMVFRAPSGQKDVPCNSAALSGGGIYDGTFQCTATFPWGTETGDWTVAWVLVIDRAGNERSLATAELAAAGFPTVMRVRGTADTEAPTITAFSFTPDSVDVRTQSRTVTVTLGAADVGTGVAPTSSNVVFRSPATDQRASCGPQLVSGSSASGTWQCQITIPAGAAGGTWEAYLVVLRDNANNVLDVGAAQLSAAGYPTQLKVTSN